MTIEEILQLAKDKKASDIHLSPGSPVMLRIDGQLLPQTQTRLRPNEVEQIVAPMLSEAQTQRLKEDGELDFAFSIPNYSRVRANVFRQRGTYTAALRILTYEIPGPEKLGLPPAVVNFTNLKRGLVLVTGATGSGKSTTLASLINIIAERDAKNIITLEDPIEYLHTNKKAIVRQREVGDDTKSYADALRAALRQDPDVILVGEMRDLETIATAITAAETGHLVFSTLHTNNTSEAIDRMIDVFPPHQQQQIRVQLSTVLEGIVSQQLLPKIDGGRIAAFEVLIANSAIRNLIREGKAFQIPSILQTSRRDGMQTMDDCIMNIFQHGLVSQSTAVAYALDQVTMIRKTQMY